MKEITREKTVVEVRGYEAVDGKWFDTKDACIEYEKSAKCVLAKELEPYKKGETNAYMLYDEEGSEEHAIEMYYIADADVLHKLNIYRNMIDSHVALIDDKYIGQTVIIFRGYDLDYAFNLGTFEDIVGRMRKAYTDAITPKEEKEN